jgi:hypothetical protein
MISPEETKLLCLNRVNREPEAVTTLQAEVHNSARLAADISVTYNYGVSGDMEFGINSGLSVLNIV